MTCRLDPVRSAESQLIVRKSQLTEAVRKRQWPESDETNLTTVASTPLPFSTARIQSEREFELGLNFAFRSEAH